MYVGRVEPEVDFELFWGWAEARPSAGRPGTGAPGVALVVVTGVWAFNLGCGRFVMAVVHSCLLTTRTLTKLGRNVAEAAAFGQLPDLFAASTAS